jgi:hypothetical protein
MIVCNCWKKSKVGKVAFCFIVGSFDLCRYGQLGIRSIFICLRVPAITFTRFNYLVLLHFTYKTLSISNVHNLI